MILCVNLNAAVDRILTVDGLVAGGLHRPISALSLPGGKGANVARALTRLGRSATVAGWIGGAPGRFIADGLASEDIATACLAVPQPTRTCTSILDLSDGRLTEFYERGAEITGDDVRAMMAHLLALLDDDACQAVALSGSLPPGAPPDVLARLIDEAAGRGLPTFLDTSGPALAMGLAAGPTMAKPNQAEAVSLPRSARPFHDEDEDEDGDGDGGEGEEGVPRGSAHGTGHDTIDLAARLAARHATTIVLSLGSAGALVALAGSGSVVAVSPPAVPAKAAVGSGDSMVAGLIDAHLDGADAVEATRRGVAAGAANTLTLGAGRFSLDDYDRILRSVVVHPVAGPSVA